MVAMSNLEPGTLAGHRYREYAYDCLFFELDSRRFALITSYVTLFGCSVKQPHCILSQRLYFSSTFPLIPDTDVDFDLIHNSGSTIGCTDELLNSN